MISFEEVYRAFLPTIDSRAAHAYVPGMDADDVHTEMVVLLWKATLTYDPEQGTPFEAYWWSLWRRKRVDILAAHHALKRPQIVYTDEPLPDHPTDTLLVPEAPPGGPLGRAIWRALAQGSSGREVRDDFEVSRRTYYEQIKQWQTDDVRRSLEGG